MSFFAEYGLFLLKTITWVAAILICLMGIIAIAAKARHQKDKVHVKRLNEKYEDIKNEINAAVLSKEQQKALKKAAKIDKKKDISKAKGLSVIKKRCYVIDFHGDMRAAQVDTLTNEINAILTVLRPEDEVIVRLESGGGVVHGYGLAASQLQRIKLFGAKLTVIIDKVAASGGYLMACVADHLYCAPFAIVGSIGVVAQLPNFNRLLKKHNIDFEQLTAGEYKRTLTLFGENTHEGREKMQEQLEQVHELFKQFIIMHRPQIDLQQVATGEYWYGQQAVELKLVDELMTSDDYILQQTKTADVFLVTSPRKKTLAEKLLGQ